MLGDRRFPLYLERYTIFVRATHGFWGGPHSKTVRVRANPRNVFLLRRQCKNLPHRSSNSRLQFRRQRASKQVQMGYLAPSSELIFQYFSQLLGSPRDIGSHRTPAEFWSDSFIIAFARERQNLKFGALQRQHFPRNFLTFLPALRNWRSVLSGQILQRQLKKYVRQRASNFFRKPEIERFWLYGFIQKLVGTCGGHPPMHLQSFRKIEFGNSKQDQIKILAPSSERLFKKNS